MNETAPEAKARSDAFVFSAGVLVTSATVLPAFLFGGLAVQMTGDLGLTPSLIGLASGLYFTAAGLSSILAGKIVERWGATRSAYAGIVLSGLCMAAIALLAHHPGTLLALMALAGPANGLGQLSSNAYLSRWAPAHRRGLFFGAKQAAIPLCTFIAGLSVPAVALTLGWRAAYLMAAVLALAALLIVRDFTGPADHAPAPGRGERKAKVGDLRLALFTLVALAGASAATSLGPFAATYAVSQGQSERYGGVLLIAGGLAGVVSRTAAGALADRFRGSELKIILGMFAGGLVGMGLLIGGSAWTIALGCMAGFALGWAWPGLLNLAVTTRYPDQPAAATGHTQTGVYFGGAVSPIAFGLVADHLGWTAAWSVSGVLFVIGAASIAAVMVTERGDRFRP
ncbi:MFS transporter [Salininema proteolyticum]|uniref:CynX/NimT family MFS transporter n=1 Tax=Salininema proteolyticum TaxID=1607685 RepID=A0ABV8U1G2_9ACTN